MNRRNKNNALPQVRLPIEELAAGGDGVGRDENGRVTFVPATAPGDVVLVQLTEEKKNFARGRLLEVIEGSSLRQEPVCRLFSKGACGGCQWQHLTQTAQREAKERIVHNAFRHFVDRGLVIEPLLEPCEALGWRRRARMAFWAGGPVVLGFHRPRSKSVTDVVHCPQLDPRLEAIYGVVREHLLPALRHRGCVELLLSEDGKCHVVVTGTVTRAGLRALAAQDCIAGVTNGKTKLGDSCVVLEDGARVSADQFAQASRAGNLALKKVVSTALGDLSGLTALELYAGNGNLTRLLLFAERIIAGDRESVTLAKNDPLNKVEWHIGEASQTLGTLLERGEQQVDVVLLDPPRGGARDCLEYIAKLTPRRIVYVSCDTATLARDADTLHELGYAIKGLQPIDLMPQTAHVEMVAQFEAS